MPYSLNELGEVVADTDGVSWADAIKQQRALRANESRVAAMYAELDELEEVEDIEIMEEVKPSSELVRIEIGDQALTASLLQRIDSMSQREAETHMALIAALHQIGTRESVVNVAAPEVTVEQPAITVEQPAITVEAAQVNVPAPNVTVNPEIVLPSVSKTITFERDFDGRVTKADVVEGSEQP